MKEYMRVYAKIDTEALIENIRHIRGILNDTTKVMMVIKADGYGHGAAAVAHALDRDVDYFAVAVIEEAVELRRQGVLKPILILGHSAPQFYTDALLNNVSLTVYSFDMAKRLSVAATANGRIGKIHIAVDTGMTRIGFDCSDESAEIIRNISKLPNIQIEGIFTHFATADEADKSFAVEQKNRFEDFCKRLEKQGVYIPMKHINNSAGIMTFPEFQYDMVRSGIISYGLYPSENVDKSALKLKPALQLKTHVVHIHTVPAGVGVSYGQTFVTKRETRIATIPVGYADGYPRSLSNNGRVIICGRYAPIIGRICMDQFMVDITDIDGVEIDSDVTLIGKDGDASITADEVAERAGTINYEIICGIGKRVPRVYI